MLLYDLEDVRPITFICQKNWVLPKNIGAAAKVCTLRKMKRHHLLVCLGDRFREGDFPNLKRLEVVFKDLDDFDNLDEERGMAIQVVDAFSDTDIHVSVKAANSYGHVWLPKFLCLAESM